MSNPLFNTLGGGMPQGNGPMQMTQQLINAINPAPIPAYQVPNPNTYYGCGCGCNTGCNC